jgi:hypothetical protein
MVDADSPRRALARAFEISPLDAWDLLAWSCDIAPVPQGIGSAAYPAGAVVSLDLM